MKVAAIILFILAGLTTLIAVNNVFLGGGGNRPLDFEDHVGFDVGYTVGYVVGSFLLPVICLIIGLVLLNKAKRRRGGGDA